MAITKEQLEQNTRDLLDRAFKLAEDLVPAAVEAELVDRKNFDDNFRPSSILLAVLLEYAQKQYDVAEADHGAVLLAKAAFRQKEIGRKA